MTMQGERDLQPRSALRASSLFACTPCFSLAHRRRHSLPRSIMAVRAARSCTDIRPVRVISAVVAAPRCCIPMCSHLNSSPLERGTLGVAHWGLRSTFRPPVLRALYLRSGCYVSGPSPSPHRRHAGVRRVFIRRRGTIRKEIQSVFSPKNDTGMKT